MQGPKCVILKIVWQSKFQTQKNEFNNLANPTNSRVAERVAPQASLAPSQAPLARGALSERLVPPFLQSVSLSAKPALSERLVPPFLQSVSLACKKRVVKKIAPPFLQSVSLLQKCKPSSDLCHSFCTELTCKNACVIRAPTAILTPCRPRPDFRSLDLLEVSAAAKAKWPACWLKLAALYATRIPWFAKPCASQPLRKNLCAGGAQPFLTRTETSIAKPLRTWYSLQQKIATALSNLFTRVLKHCAITYSRQLRPQRQH